MGQFHRRVFLCCFGLEEREAPAPAEPPPPPPLAPYYEVADGPGVASEPNLAALVLASESLPQREVRVPTHELHDLLASSAGAPSPHPAKDNSGAAALLEEVRAAFAQGSHRRRLTPEQRLQALLEEQEALAAHREGLREHFPDLALPSADSGNERLEAAAAAAQWPPAEPSGRAGTGDPAHPSAAEAAAPVCCPDAACTPPPRRRHLYEAPLTASPTQFFTPASRLSSSPALEATAGHTTIRVGLTPSTGDIVKAADSSASGAAAVPSDAQMGCSLGGGWSADLAVNLQAALPSSRCGGVESTSSSEAALLSTVGVVRLRRRVH